MTASIITALSLGVAAFIFALDRFGILPRRGTAADAAGELDIARSKAERLEGENKQLLAQNAALTTKTDLAPVLETLTMIAETNKQVMERLVQHNGSFAHMKESLSEIAASTKTQTEAMRVLSGFVVASVEPSVKVAPKRRPRKTI